VEWVLLRHHIHACKMQFPRLSMLVSNENVDARIMLDAKILKHIICGKE
jgi:hypothetical protein